ncbi:LytR/AlgR family response regulator transcription factor [Aquimarina brevivitae]|uniref:LytTR family two component transcriptional regulator n=1 Tax=Aquimarina brevivitae TaxID=323412 RepID=A0A4Q7P1E0_9FLAO|nr:LytTR family DNA-binding domain-containing protein [Aquimarina brevivitae]RZS93377.1 LytTR family two component transcriptional regulator [Aquimarina brevivitae]
MIRAIIIEDEPNAIELLQRYIAKIPFIECIQSFRNPVEALAFLQTKSVDLIFLDINMPQLSGISFLQTLKNPPHIILTTAYAEYAVQSYEYQVTDYLLKPIAFERFLKAVVQLNENIPSATVIKENQSSKELFIKSGAKQVKLNKDAIVYLAKDGNYITYYTEEKKVLARESIQEALEHLGSDFIQIHKSTIVNLNRIESYETSHINTSLGKLAIGPSYRTLFQEALKIRAEDKS